MKKLFALPLAAVVALGAACSDTGRVAGPDGANFELTDPDKRVLAANVNAHVYGSFSVTFEGAPGVITSGPANFPGNPKNAGTCDNGRWINPQGKPTSGSMEKPHPHCVGTGSATVEVVLEPISVTNGNIGGTNEFLKFAKENDDGRVRRQVAGINDQTNAEGVIVAYAIDAATNKRVGTLTIDLTQYHSTGTSGVNYFVADCVIDDETRPRCLDLVIEADYEPLAAPDGVGIATQGVTGFLWWTPASEPYNYGS